MVLEAETRKERWLEKWLERVRMRRHRRRFLRLRGSLLQTREAHSCGHHTASRRGKKETRMEWGCELEREWRSDPNWEGDKGWRLAGVAERAQKELEFGRASILLALKRVE